MSIVEVRVCGRYKLGAKIGTGTFGSIYLAKNVQTNVDVAIKAEEQKSKHPQLLYEGKILQSLQGGIGISNMFWCGQEGDYNFLITELLGQNLEELMMICSGKFSLKTVLMIADQILSILEYIHFKNYIHRDIKPDNFLLGLGKRQKNIYLIDFGIAKRYRDQHSHQHITFKDKKPLIGTTRYTSLNAHNGYELSRRDDLESLAYMLIYFLKGSLPWQGQLGDTKEDKYLKIKEKKTNTTIDQLCQGLPPEFVVYLKYVRGLKFEEKPDYTYLKKIFKERFVREGFEFDYVYDWLLIPLSKRNPKLQIKIPITVDLINNEDELLKQYDESNFSRENIEQGLSPREFGDEFGSAQKDGLDDQIHNSNKIDDIQGVSKQQTINKARILKPDDQQDNIQANQKFPQGLDENNNSKKQKKDSKKKGDCMIF